MGMRLEGPKIENIVDTNIKSEGLIKGCNTGSSRWKSNYNAF
jgi:allophanate hydrolase subunit 2